MNFDFETASTFDMGGVLPRGDREQMRRAIAILEDLPSALALGEELKTDQIPVFSVEIDPSQREGDVQEVDDDSEVEFIGENLAENEAQGDEFIGLKQEPHSQPEAATAGSMTETPMEIG